MNSPIGQLQSSWRELPWNRLSGDRLTRLGIVFVIILSLIILVRDVRRVLQDRMHEVADAQISLRNLAQSAAEHANSAIRLADATGASIALQLESEGTAPSQLLRLQQRIHSQVSTLPVLNNVLIFDETGNTVLSIVPALANPAQVTARDSFRYHQSHTDTTAFVGRPVRALSNGRLVVPVTHRVNHPDGRFAGFVTASIELAYFDVFYRGLEINKGGSIGLFFDDRTLLSSNRNPDEPPWMLDPALDAGRLSITSADSTRTTDTQSRSEWYHGHAHLDGYPLVAIASMSSDTILARWRESTWRSVWSSLLLLLILGLLGAILIFNIRCRRVAEATLDDSAKQFRLVIDGIEDYGIYLLDTEGLIISWNAGAQRLTGFAREDIVGRHFSTLDTIEDIAEGRPRRNLEDALHAGRSEDERWRVRKDGTRFIVNVITTLLYNNAGDHYGFLKVARDVTASRQSAALLEASEFRWKFALEGAGEGVFDWNEQTGAIHFSRTYLAMLGYEENEIEGSFDGWKRLAHPDDLKGVYAAFAAHHEGRAPNYTHEYRMRCKDGSYKWVAARGMVVSRDADGKALRTIGTQSDISKLKAAEQRLSDQNAMIMQTNAKLALANQVKSEFLANMSHELRTPLNAVLGFTGTLLMELPGPLNQAQKSQLQIVRDSGRHLLDLISEILDLSKIESGRADLTLKGFNCQELIAHVSSLLIPLAREKAITLSIDMPTQYIRVFTDARLLKQILINLVGNAIKFTEAGAVTVRLRGNPDSTAEPAFIDVIDTGIGIDAADFDKLFQPFTQLETGLSRRFEGTGLGLNLSKKYADLIGAKLFLQSTPAQGSVFTIELPRNGSPGNPIVQPSDDA